jgi:hypothetical protein
MSASGVPSCPPLRPEGAQSGNRPAFDGLKKIDDATFLRRKILLAFEKAETETDERDAAPPPRRRADRR